MLDGYNIDARTNPIASQTSASNRETASAEFLLTAAFVKSPLQIQKSLPRRLLGNTNWEFLFCSKFDSRVAPVAAFLGVAH